MDKTKKYDRVYEIRQTVRGVASTLDALTEAKAIESACSGTLDEVVWFLAQQAGRAADALEQIESEIMKGEWDHSK